VQAARFPYKPGRYRGVVRTVDLAVYADSLAAEAATLSARLERARGRLRQAGIEREAREALPAEVVMRLRRLGLLHTTVESHATLEVEELQRSCAAVEQLQGWVEARLEQESQAHGDQAGIEAASGIATTPRSPVSRGRVQAA